MKCTTCTHKAVCIHKVNIEEFAATSGIDMFITIGVQKCALCSNGDFIPTEMEEITEEIIYDKNEEIIKDFSKRSEMIKKSYRDANGGEVICPTCKSKTAFLTKCIDCDKPVCPECGVTVSSDAKESGMLCQSCWTEMSIKDDEIQNNAVVLDGKDSSFLKTVVRHDIPEHK